MGWLGLPCPYGLVLLLPPPRLPQACSLDSGPWLPQPLLVRESFPAGCVSRGSKAYATAWGERGTNCRPGQMQVPQVGTAAWSGGGGWVLDLEESPVLSPAPPTSLPAFSFLIFFFFFLFRAAPVRHMEVPRLGVESELQPPACTATASRVCDLHHSSRPRWILNPLSEAKD